MTKIKTQPYPERQLLSKIACRSKQTRNIQMSGCDYSQSIYCTSKRVGTTLKTIAERMKLIARLPRSIVLFKAPVSRLNTTAMLETEGNAMQLYGSC